MRRVSSVHETTVSFDDRVAVTALALLEGASPQPVDGLRGDTLDARAIERFRVLPQGRAIESVMHDLGAWPRSMMRVVVAVLVILVAVGSAALVSSTGAVSVPAVLLGTLALQTVLLIAWVLTLIPGVGTAMRRVLVRVLTGPAQSVARLSTIAAESIRTPEAVAEWIARWKRGVERDHAVVAASVEAMSIAYAPKRSVLAALVYGVWSNAAWVVANVLMLGVMAVQLLRSRNYTLHSGLISPELSREWVDGVVRVLSAALPQSMLPDADAMARAALEPSGIAADSWRWGTMLLASVVVFGLLPRVVALAVAMAALPMARRRWRVPWDDVRLAATRGVIESSAPPVTVLARERVRSTDPAAHCHGAGTSALHGAAVASVAAGASRRPALLRAGDARNPFAPGVAIDLGSVTAGGLDACDAIADRITREGFDPIILLCSLTTAPRLGVADLLRTPLHTGSGRVIAILTDAARLRRGSSLADLRSVLQAWRRLLESLGVMRIIELDGSLAKARGLAPLQALLTGHQVRPALPALLPTALDAIVDAAASWGERDPSSADERRLIDRVGSVYGAESLSASAPFIVTLADEDAGVMREAADRAVGVMSRASGLETLEAHARAADRRAMALAGAVQLAVELEYQGLGESKISEAIETAMKAWKGAGAAQASWRERADHVCAALQRMPTAQDSPGLQGAMESRGPQGRAAS